MGQLWKQHLLKLSVKCKTQILKKPVAAFNLWLCKCQREQQTPCATCWQRDSPGDHLTLLLSGKAVTGLQVLCHDRGVEKNVLKALLKKSNHPFSFVP